MQCHRARRGGPGGAYVIWSSDRDGSIGTGPSFSTAALSDGIHRIQASVTDSPGAAASATITLINSNNHLPVVTIQTPPNGTSYLVGTQVSFSGSATDTEEGDLSAALVWTSSRDGVIGSGPTLSTTSLSVGTHSIEAKASDAQEFYGSAVLSLTIFSPTTVTLTSVGADDGWVLESTETSGAMTKVETADPQMVEAVRRTITIANPQAKILESTMPITVDDPLLIKGKRVLVVEDGPTLTHGGMSYGAGVLAAKQYGAAAMIDPRAAAVGSLRQTFQSNPHLDCVLPAMGYGSEQIRDLEHTINRADCDLVLIATPVDLRRLISIRQPTCRVGYEFEPGDEAILKDMLSAVLREGGQG